MSLLPFLAWWLLVWAAAAVFFGLLIGAAIKVADRHDAARAAEADHETLLIPLPGPRTWWA